MLTRLAGGTTRGGVLDATAAGVAAAVVLPVSGASAGDGPHVQAAQTGCGIVSVRMYSHYSSRYRRHYIIFRPAIRCTSQTYWKVTLTIRRRRFGPDATSASKQVKGHGSRRFVLGAGCKNGNHFNGDIWVNIQPGGPTLHAVKKNVEC